MTELLAVVGSIWTAIAGTGGLVELMLATPILLIPLAFVFVRKTISATRALTGGGGRRK